MRSHSRRAEPPPYPTRRLPSTVWPDLLAIVGLLALMLRLSWPLIGGTIIGQDATTFFYLNDSFLGAQLRSGHIPVWNPHQLAGIPFAGDPESGWTYLPAMLAFSALPFVAAIKAYLIAQLTLQAVSAYLLARALGFVVAGAFAAAALFTLSTFSFVHHACCPIYGQVDGWLPVLLLGTLLAARAATLPRILAAWGLAGLAWSQILASWLGQGSYYVALIWIAFLVYTAVDQLAHGASPRDVAPGILGTGAGIAGLGGLLAMAGILPRLEANASSIIPGGRYEGALATVATAGGVRWRDLVPGWFNGHAGSYPGIVVLSLATLAVLLAGWRLGVPFFAVVSAGAVLLAWHQPTPLHRLLDLLPAFARLSEHQPQRVLVFLPFGLAFLAGAAIGELWRRRPSWPASALLLAAAAFWPLAMRQIRQDHPRQIADWIVHNAWWALFLLAATLLGRRLVPRAGGVIVAALLVLALLDGLHGGTAVLQPKWSFYRTDLATYYAPVGAARFLQAKNGGEPTRSFGFSPALLNTKRTTYRNYFGDPRHFGVQPVQPLLVNNLATLYGLEDIQGYNPQQMQRYVDFMDALNGRRQEYHESNVLPSGLSSPLLDVLGARYVVLPAQVNWGDPRLAPLAGSPVVYRDATVQIVARPTAYPRAWLTHEVVRMDRPHALAALANGAYDLRRTALIEGPLPTVAEPPANRSEVVSFARYEPVLVRLQVQAQAPALLVLSDLYDPAWHASVDGHPARVYATDEALRGVAVPAGTHVVTFRFVEPWLTVGIAVSAATALLAASLPLAAALVDDRAARRWRRPKPGKSLSTSARRLDAGARKASSRIVRDRGS